MSKKSTKEVPQEAPEEQPTKVARREIPQNERDGVGSIARAIAVAQGHPNPDHFAACTVAAYCYEELPRNPTDDVPEDCPAEPPAEPPAESQPGA